jgi:hypothetical protein
VRPPGSTPSARPRPARVTPEGERLRGKIELVLPELWVAGDELFTHPRIADLYGEYLLLCHWVVRASVPLMETALRRAEELSATDPVAKALTGYLVSHIDEELDHDKWLLEDLESLNIPRAQVLKRPPTATVAGLVGAQYYWIFHYHPVALLGYITVLESYPMSREAIDDLAARTGLGPAAFRTLVEHADLDPHHAEELHRTIDALRLSREQSSVLGSSALHTIVALATAFREIAASANTDPGGS